MWWTTTVWPWATGNAALVGVAVAALLIHVHAAYGTAPSDHQKWKGFAEDLYAHRAQFAKVAIVGAVLLGLYCLKDPVIDWLNRPSAPRHSDVSKPTVNDTRSAKAGTSTYKLVLVDQQLFVLAQGQRMQVRIPEWHRCRFRRLEGHLTVEPQGRAPFVCHSSGETSDDVRYITFSSRSPVVTKVEWKLFRLE